MIGCLRTRVRKQPVIALCFESENELKFYNLEAWCIHFRYYRPLENRAATSGDEVLMLDDDEQGYTENYTIV